MKKSILVVAALVFVYLLVRFIVSSMSVIESMERSEKENPLTYTPHRAPQEFLKLFKDNDKLGIKTTTYSKIRSPWSEFYFNNKYYISVCKLGKLDKKEISGVVVASHIHQYMTHDAAYSAMNDVEPFFADRLFIRKV